jgi:hypothetical protein
MRTAHTANGASTPTARFACGAETLPWLKGMICFRTCGVRLHATTQRCQVKSDRLSSTSVLPLRQRKDIPKPYSSATQSMRHRDFRASLKWVKNEIKFACQTTSVDFENLFGADGSVSVAWTGKSKDQAFKRRLVILPVSRIMNKVLD